MAARLACNYLAVFESHERWGGNYAAVLGEVRPLTATLGVRDGDDVFPALNLGELTFHVLAGSAAFLNEEMDLWGLGEEGVGHGREPLGFV